MGIFEIYRDTPEGRVIIETLACIDEYSVRVYAMIKYGKDFTGVRGNPFTQAEVKPFDWRVIENYERRQLGQMPAMQN